MPRKRGPGRPKLGRKARTHVVPVKFSIDEATNLMTQTNMLQIKFLDGHAPIDVCSRPTVLIAPAGKYGSHGDIYGPDLSIGWGDRESDLLSGDTRSRREIRMLPPRVYATKVYETGDDRYDMPAPSATADIARVQALVDEIWRDTATVAPAVKSYQQILQKLHDEGLRHELQWANDARAIAKAFRRARVEIGEQTVPGKVCVRSSRGRLLGYANCWDGRWLGTVERVRRGA